MHEGKHGLLDDIDDIDDLFGNDDDCTCKCGHDPCICKPHDHKH